MTQAVAANSDAITPPSAPSSVSEKQLRQEEEEEEEHADDHPTAADLATLRRVSAHIPLKLFTIATVELCERFSYYGTIIVYTNFIQWPLPPGSTTGAGGSTEQQSGALGMGQRASTGITALNAFWQFATPLLGAYVADQYWGRYRTICVALGVGIAGHLVLVASAVPPVVTRAPENSLAALIVGIIIIGFGTGGFLPNISPLIAEQLDTDRLRVVTLPRTAERVVVDPAITINRVYNWFYLFINIGALIGQLTMVYAEAYVGFWLSFLLPTCMLCVCPAIMWWGRSHYRDRKPAGSVLGKAVRTFALANRGRWHILPWITWRRLHDGTFWDRVKPSRFAPGTKPKWMTFDDAKSNDNSRRGFGACQVFLWYPIYWLTYNQLNNNLISQAAVMKLNGLPNDMLGNLDPLAFPMQSRFIPICDFGLYPLLRRWKINFTPIKKITAGFFTGAAAMVWAAVIQHRIYSKSECGAYASGQTAAGEQCAPVDLLVWAQSGAYVLIALSEIFASITSIEYAFSKAPKNMRSTVQAVAMFMTAISSALAEAFVSLSADPLLVWNYATMAVMASLGGALFWWTFREMDQKEDDLNELPEGRLFVEDA